MKITKHALIIMMAIALAGCMNIMAFASGSVSLTKISDTQVSVDAIGMIGLKTFDFVITTDDGIVIKNVKRSSAESECTAAGNSFTTEFNKDNGYFSGYFKEELWEIDKWNTAADNLGDPPVSFDPESFNLGTIVFDVSDVVGPSYIYLNGYYKVKVGGTRIPVSAKICVKNTLQKYTIAYDANGGTNAPASQTKNAGKGLTLSSAKPVKSYKLTYNANGGSVSDESKTVNATFKSWNTKLDGSGTTYLPGANYTKDNAAILYAQWENPQAGKLATPIRNGYTFAGWYTKSTGGTKVTSDSVISAHVTLYAHWEGKLMGDVDDNGEISSVDARLALREAVELENFSEEQKLLSDMNNDNKVTAADARQILRICVGLELSWHVGEPVPPAIYYVSFDALAGKGAPKSQIKKEGTALTLSKAKPTKTYTITYNANGGSVSPASKTVNATFKNWNTKADGSGTAYSPGAVYTSDTNITLYAQWTPQKAGTLATPSRSGYTFEGWFTAASGGSQVTNNTNIDKDQTLYAHWTQLYSVSYNANGGTGAPTTQTKKQGTNLTLSKAKPTRSFTITYNANGGNISSSSKTIYATFKSWNTVKNGSGIAYAPGAVYTADKSITLYAQWELKKAETLATPTRSGYTFTGWFTAASGGSQITKDTLINKNLTVYAHWSKQEKLKKAEKLVGDWVEDPYAYDELSITSLGDGTFRASLFYYRIASYDYCYGEVNSNGSITFSGHAYESWDDYIEFRAEPAQNNKLKVVVLNCSNAFVKTKTFMRPGATPSATLDYVWSQLQGYYWLQKPENNYSGNNMCLLFDRDYVSGYYDDGFMFGYGLWQSEGIYCGYIDSSTMQGDLNGIVTFTAIVEDVTYSSDPKWKNTRNVKISFDFTNLKNGKIRYKYGSGAWETFAYKYYR